MKKSLGSLILFALLSVNLFAYKWSAYISTSQAYKNDSIYLKYECLFDDDGALYTIDFYPKGVKESFDLRLLSREEKVIDGQRKVVFEYVAKVKRIGTVVFDFTPHMKKTTLESIVYTSGSRDDDKGDTNFILEKIDLEKLRVVVKENETPIIGAFTLDVLQDKKEVKAYEPYHLDIEISGTGNFEDIKSVEYKIDGVKVFSQKPITRVHLTKDGFKGTWNQKFAFIGSKDFIIPSKTIVYFDKIKNALKTLDISSLEVNVTASYIKEELLDEVEETLSIDYKYIYYFLTFIAGFMLAKIPLRRKKLSSKESLLIKKINNTKSKNELSMLLIIHNQQLFQDIITYLESDSAFSLAKAKKNAIKLEIKKR